MKQQAIEFIKENKIIVIVRGVAKDSLLKTAEAIKTAHPPKV